MEELKEELTLINKRLENIELLLSNVKKDTEDVAKYIPFVDKLSKIGTVSSISYINKISKIGTVSSLNKISEMLNYINPVNYIKQKESLGIEDDDEL
jgi:hypothetical protein